MRSKSFLFCDKEPRALASGICEANHFYFMTRSRAKAKRDLRSKSFLFYDKEPRAKAKRDLRSKSFYMTA
ncbi:MAG: hypothetical protein A3E54_07180 [Gammaproteobacteria bacterium RIFCSPHIGHO2_12_FULL_41_25]|nr:MAG: hypothetical protein A3B71_01485 [Gammaproteobacteria bacterium RIFCSPHIGHO2_02_FULL_42_43]OGT52652.1 MAG: hypothetical protein A3E54_07180 [Gammaproteobacteria bacterium RIFCSPHIGHO2_12_FULL_41_25]OGT86939.1 MAG: hypothetical protein A3G86_06355 [Gammaproteobacteria bacterium RIFCSPLOWO2_12_FULL_42_18]